MIADFRVDRCRGIYHNPGLNIRVMQRCGLVGVQIDQAVVEFTTPDAVKIGLDLVRKAQHLEPGEFMKLTINGSDIHLLPEVAERLGGSLLRKADRADDWQRAVH